MHLQLFRKAFGGDAEM